MNALLRYAIMKGVREHYLTVLLFTPSLMFVTPLLATAVFEVIRGRGRWPLGLYKTISPEAATNILAVPALLLSVVIAGTGAFWVFRMEIAARTIGFFYLARRSGVVAAAATIFGATVGMLSYVISTALIGFLTASIPSKIGQYVVAAAIASLFAAALGTLLVGVSADLSMLIPIYPATIAVTVMLVENPSLALSLSTIGAAALVAVAGAFLWRRRCAA